jgi:selenocysteine lyase/cysteine desulfurase
MARRTPRLPIASVAFDGRHVRHTVLAGVLSDSFGVMVRAGFHCTHPLYDDLRMQDGAVRISAYLYNDLAELDYAGQSIDAALTRLGRAGR